MDFNWSKDDSNSTATPSTNDDLFVDDKKDEPSADDSSTPIATTPADDKLELPQDPNDFFKYHEEDAEKPETLKTPDDTEADPVDPMIDPATGEEIDVDSDIEKPKALTDNGSPISTTSLESGGHNDLLQKLEEKVASLTAEQEEISGKLEKISSIKTDLEAKIAEVKHLQEEAADIIS